jgi:hypothetical protein
MATVRHLGLFPNIQIAGKRLCVISKTDQDDQIPDYGPGTYYPVAMSLRAVLALYWRIRKWKFIHTLDGNNQPEEAVAQYQSPPTSETDLICGFSAGGENKTIEYGMTTEAEFATDLSVSAMTIFGFGQKGPIILQVDGALYPRLNIAWEGPIRYFEETEENEGLGSSSAQIDGEEERGKLTLKVLQDEYKIPMYANSENAFYCGEIEAAEFWEYDPGDGLGPIYDKTTGAQLRAFPTGTQTATT